MIRLIVIVVLLVGLAVAVPKVAPAIVSGLSEDRASLPSSAVAASVDEPEPDTPLTPRTVILDADRRGHFLTPVEVNGRDLEAMVDTGATIVALNEATAVRLGILPPRSAFTEPVSTVNGLVKVAPVVLSEVRVRGIALRDVPAIVVPGTLLETNLLGMSFLGKLSRFEVSGGRLVLVE
jgi:aspartyl protease family protein